MIPIPCKDDMERLMLEIRLNFEKPEEISEERMQKLIDSFDGNEND